MCEPLATTEPAPEPTAATQPEPSEGALALAYRLAVATYLRKLQEQAQKEPAHV